MSFPNPTIARLQRDLEGVRGELESALARIDGAEDRFVKAFFDGMEDALPAEVEAGWERDLRAAFRKALQPTKETYTREQLLSDEAIEAAAKWPHEQEVPGVWADDDSWEFEDGHDPRARIREDAKGQIVAALDAIDKGKGGDDA